nr:MAG TPA: minor tail protein [Caudoviricetes sp.]
MANRTVDVTLRLVDKFTGGIQKSLKSITAMDKNTARIAGDIQKAGDSIASTGTAITAAVTVPIVGAGVAAVKTAADFESSMSGVKAIMGEKWDDSLTEQAKHLGATTAWTAREVGEAMQYTAMAGWDAKQNMEGLNGILSAASAGGIGLAEATDVMVGALAGFGEGADQAEKYADIMTATFTNTKTDMLGLGESYKYVGSLAGTLGYDFAEVNTAIGIMGNASIDGSQAGTTLRTALLNMTGDSKEVKKAMGELGISMTNSDGTMKSFSDVMHDMKKGFSGLTEEGKLFYANQIFGKTATAGMLAVINSTDDAYDSLERSIKGASGAAGEAASGRLDNLNGQLTLLKSAIEGIAIRIGDFILPYLKQFVEWAQKLADKLNSMSDEQLKAVLKNIALVASIGPMLIAFGKLVKIVGIVIKVFALVSKAGGFIAVITGPVGLVIAAILVLIGIVLLVRKHFDVFKQALSKFSPVFENIMVHLNGIKDTVLAGWEAISPVLGTFINWLGERLVASIGVTIGLISSVAEIVVGVVEGIIKVIGGIIEFLVGVFTGDWEKAWKGVQDVVEGIFTAIFSFISGIINGIIGAVKNVIDAIGSIVVPNSGETGTATATTVPKMAGGTMNWTGGLVQVSERGGEIIDLPSGSRIYPHDQSVAMARAEGRRMTSTSISVNVSGNNFTVREEADINKIGDAIARKLSMAISNRGGWTFSGNMA